MKTFIVMLCLTAMVLGENLPDAPSTSRNKIYIHNQSLSASYTEIPDVETHHKRKVIIWTIVGSILLTSVIIGLNTRGKSCPSSIWYEGKAYPYNGTYDSTHPCPVEPPGIPDSRH